MNASVTRQVYVVVSKGETKTIGLVLESGFNPCEGNQRYEVPPVTVNVSVPPKSTVSSGALPLIVAPGTLDMFMSEYLMIVPEPPPLEATSVTSYNPSEV